MNFETAKSSLVPGCLIPLHEDFMNEIGLLGTVELIEFVGECNTEQTFIRKEMPSNKQEVWAPRKARIRIKQLTEKGIGYKLTIDSVIVKEIAYPYRIGNTPSGWYSPVRHEDKDFPVALNDKFIIVNGIRCF